MFCRLDTLARIEIYMLDTETMVRKHNVVVGQTTPSYAVAFLHTFSRGDIKLNIGGHRGT